MAYEGRRIATGTLTSTITSVIGGLYDYVITFDNPLNTVDYVVVASVYSPSSSILGAVTPAGIKAKTTTGCTVTVKASGILSNGAIQIDVVATRRVTA